MDSSLTTDLKKILTHNFRTGDRIILKPLRDLIILRAEVLRCEAGAYTSADFTCVDYFKGYMMPELVHVFKDNIYTVTRTSAYYVHLSLNGETVLDVDCSEIIVACIFKKFENTLDEVF